MNIKKNVYPIIRMSLYIRLKFMVKSASEIWFSCLSFSFWIGCKANLTLLSFPSEKAMNSPCFILKNKSDLGFDTSFSPLVIHKRKTKFCLKFSSEKLGETYRGYRFFRRTNLNANILRVYFSEILYEYYPVPCFYGCTILWTQ